MVVIERRLHWEDERGELSDDGSYILLPDSAAIVRHPASLEACVQLQCDATSESLDAAA